MSKTKKMLAALGVFTMLSTLAIPLSSISAKEVITRNQISVGVGISKMVGVETSANVPGSGVSYSNGTYSKAMVGGEKIENFGKITLKVICNFNSNSDTSFEHGYNCKDNGWSLLAASQNTKQSGGVTYASMNSTTGQSSILSKSSSFSTSESNWALKVSPVSRSISGTDVSPTVPTAFKSTHIVPATATEIASGKSWKTISGIDTYIDSFGVDVQYGINLSNTQASGTFIGIVNYTVSLKASA